MASLNEISSFSNFDYQNHQLELSLEFAYRKLKNLKIKTISDLIHEFKSQNENESIENTNRSSSKLNSSQTQQVLMESTKRYYTSMFTVKEKTINRRDDIFDILSKFSGTRYETLLPVSLLFSQNTKSKSKYAVVFLGCDHPENGNSLLFNPATTEGKGIFEFTSMDSLQSLLSVLFDIKDAGISPPSLQDRQEVRVSILKRLSRNERVRRKKKLLEQAKHEIGILEAKSNGKSKQHSKRMTCLLGAGNKTLENETELNNTENVIMSEQKQSNSLDAERNSMDNRRTEMAFENALCIETEYDIPENESHEQSHVKKSKRMSISTVERKDGIKSCSNRNLGEMTFGSSENYDTTYDCPNDGNLSAKSYFLPKVVKSNKPIVEEWNFSSRIPGINEHERGSRDLKRIIQHIDDQYEKARLAIDNQEKQSNDFTNTEQVSNDETLAGVYDEESPKMKDNCSVQPLSMQNSSMSQTDRNVSNIQVGRQNATYKDSIQTQLIKTTQDTHENTKSDSGSNTCMSSVLGDRNIQDLKKKRILNISLTESDQSLNIRKLNPNLKLRVSMFRERIEMMDEMKAKKLAEKRYRHGIGVLKSIQLCTNEVSPDCSQSRNQFSSNEQTLNGIELELGNIELRDDCEVNNLDEIEDNASRGFKEVPNDPSFFKKNYNISVKIPSKETHICNNPQEKFQLQETPDIHEDLSPYMPESLTEEQRNTMTGSAYIKEDISSSTYNAKRVDLSVKEETEDSYANYLTDVNKVENEKKELTKKECLPLKAESDVYSDTLFKDLVSLDAESKYDSHSESSPLSTESGSLLSLSYQRLEKYKHSTGEMFEEEVFKRESKYESGSEVSASESYEKEQIFNQHYPEEEVEIQNDESSHDEIMSTQLHDSTRSCNDTGNENAENKAVWKFDEVHDYEGNNEESSNEHLPSPVNSENASSDFKLPRKGVVFDVLLDADDSAEKSRKKKIKLQKLKEQERFLKRKMKKAKEAVTKVEHVHRKVHKRPEVTKAPKIKKDRSIPLLRPVAPPSIPVKKTLSMLHNSNKQVIQNALTHNVFAGVNVKDYLKRQSNGGQNSTHFIIAFRKEVSLKFRSLYIVLEGSKSLHKLVGSGPVSVQDGDPMILSYLKYNTGQKMFHELSTKSLSKTTDAVVFEPKMFNKLNC